MDLDVEVKKKLAAAGVQLAMPVVQTAVRHHYDSKLIEQQKEMEVEVAEKRANGLAEISAQQAAASARESAVEASAPAPGPQPAGGTRVPNAADPYAQLQQIRDETRCGFCAMAAEGLQDAPRDEAILGLQELRALEEERERAKQTDMSEDEIERNVERLVSEWEVVPRYAGVGN